MKTIHLIGIGSPWKWDRVAWMVLNALHYHPAIKNLLFSKRLKISLLDRPNLQLLEYLHPEHKTIIIDAILLDAPFGEILEARINQEFIEQLENRLLPNYSSHGIDLIQTLALGNALKQLPDDLYFIGFNVWNAVVCQEKLLLLRQFRHALNAEILAT